MFQKSPLPLLLVFGLTLGLLACFPQRPAAPSSGAASSPRLAALHSQGRLVVGTALTPPFQFRDPHSNALRGYDVELMEKIAARLGLRLEWRELAFADLLSVLERGEVDVVIAGLYITPEREERVDMSQPYLRTGLALVVQSENIHIRSLEDLAGQVVGVKEGATGDQLATYLRTEGGIPLQVRRYTDTPDSLADLDAGRLDAVFNDYINTLEYAKHHPGVRVQGDIFSPAGLGIAVQSGDWELLALVNAALDVFEQDGTLEALWQKWIALRVQP